MGNEEQPGGAGEPAQQSLADAPIGQPGRGPLGAAIGSLVWPGMGHLLSGQKRRGAVIAGSSLLALLIVVALVLRERRTAVVSWAVQPNWLRAAIAVSLALFVVRFVVGLDAYLRRLRLDRQRLTATHIGALAVVVVVAMFPHALAVQAASAQLDLLDEVFDATDTVAAQPTELATKTTSVSATNDVDPPLSPAASPPATPTRSVIPPTTVPATTTTQLQTVATWDGDSRLTILLLGSDGGFDRTGIRTDTIIALSIDVATGDAVAFSIPRNWKRMQFPVGTPAAARFPDGYIGLANEVYNLGRRFPDTFPDTDDPGGASIKAAVAQLLGTPVHYYALVDMVGVVEAIDLFGGIDVTVTEWIDDDIKPITPQGPRLIIKTSPGPHHFDGLTALAYVRARTTSSDYHRMTRQRCVVGALIDQVGVTEVLTNYPRLSNIISDHLSTDIPLDRLPELLEIAARLETDRILTINFTPPEYPRGAAPIPLVRAVAAAAFSQEVNIAFEMLDLACRGK